MKPIPSAPGYFACESGHIWRNGSARIAQSNGRGYLRIKLSINNKQRDAYVHRLVCEAFHGPCPEGLQCRHLNGNRTDNRPTNLQWSDKKTNEADKFIHGTIARGEHSGQAKLTTSIVLEARRRAALGQRVDLIAQDMNVPYRSLLASVAGRTWAHLPGSQKLLKGAQRQQLEARKAGKKLRRHFLRTA